MPNETTTFSPVATGKTKEKIFYYLDHSTKYADYSEIKMTITDEDLVTVSAIVISKGYKTNDKGPHNHVMFVEQDDTIIPKLVEMGEFHWDCGQNGEMHHTFAVKGAYLNADKHPTWSLEIPRPHEC